MEDTTILYSEPQGLTPRRTYSSKQWRINEMLILVNAKQWDIVVHGKNASKKIQMESSVECYKKIEEHVWENGVHRSRQQCQDKWKQLSADFKKLYDYQKHIPSGKISYWEMTSQE